MQLPTLYKKTKTGAVQQYVVDVAGDTITVSQGKVGGKMQDYHTKCEPKNVGRSNETSAEMQAELEATSKWKKKRDREGYSEDPSGEIQLKLPMKVKVYQDNLKNVEFPCYVSPKLDGVNAIYRLEGAKLTLYSRGGLEYPPIPHLEKHIRLAMSSLKCTELNGELYIPDSFLQDITSAVKKPKALSKHLEFHIFDVPDMREVYGERAKALMRLNINPIRPIKVVIMSRVGSHDDVEDLHGHYTRQGYEGIVIRNTKGAYKYNERSSDVFKYKKAADAEFQVVDYNFDKYQHVVFHCDNGDGKLFKVKPKGTANERLKMAALADEYLGKWLTVEFETLSKDKVPLKPVGLNFRECDAEGAPIE